MALTDAQLLAVLDRTIGLIDPVLDVLSQADPLDLKSRTHRDAPASSCPARTADGLAWTLDVADWPGTAGWDELSMNERADWWVTRVGAVTTTAVAFPNMFGFVARLLPLNAWLGFAGQALVVRAVAREYGATSRESGVAMLADIMFDRDLGPLIVEADGANLPDSQGLVPDLIRIGRTLYDLNGSLGGRPGPPRLARWATWVPLLGGPITYLGERVALRHAVTACRAWIVEHPTTVAVRSDQ